MQVVRDLAASIQTNPATWFLFVLLILAEYGNYTLGHDLDQVCSLLGDHEVSYGHPITPREKIDTICLSREPDERPDDE